MVDLEDFADAGPTQPEDQKADLEDLGYNPDFGQESSGHIDPTSQISMPQTSCVAPMFN